MPHIHTGDGEFDFTVAGYIVHDDKTLLIKHKYLPIWTSPSGHVEPNQTPIDALYAEIREEAGITREHLQLIETAPYPADRRTTPGGAMKLALPFDIEVHAITDTHSHTCLSYVLRSDTNNVEPGPGESNTFKWLSLDELRTFTETNDSIRSAAIFAIEHAAKAAQA